jgi:hypothetical protein
MSARKTTKKTKRISLVAGIVLLVALLAFAEVIRPDQDARAYTARLQSASQPLGACFQKLANTTQLDVYYAPDIPIKEKQDNIRTINNQINSCRTQLASFNKQSQDLLNLHFAGYTQTYHQAKVNQRQAYDVIGQSEDVLNQYADMANFLDQYYGHIGAFLSYFDNLQTVEKSGAYTSNANIAVLTSQASDLHKRAADIRGMPANVSFDPTKPATADMFDAMAAGFDNVVRGYSGYGDYTRNLGFQQVDAAVATYDTTVVNLPFDQLNASYVPKQVQQLPVKVKNLLAAQFE